MDCLIDLTLMPTGGWEYTHPTTGVRIAGGSYRDWKNRVREHDISNGLPIGTLWEWELQNALCAQKPPGFCRECTGEASAPRAVDAPKSDAKPCRYGCGGGRAR